MVYSGLNENEIAKITKILDEQKVNYQVLVHEEALERINNLSDDDRNKFRRQSKRSGQSLMQIEIDSVEFKKISEVMKDRLHALGIYEEVESPFTEEELNSPGTSTEKKHLNSTSTSKFKQYAVFSFFAVFILLMLLGKGMF